MKKYIKRIAVCILLCTVAAGILALLAVYQMKAVPSGYTWIYPWMEVLLCSMAAGFMILAGILWLPRGPVKAVMIPAVLVCSILPAAAAGLLSPVRSVVKFSPGKENMLVLDVEAENGRVTAMRTAFFVLKTEQKQFPFTSSGDMKYQWIQEDVCAVTYQDTDDGIHQYLATFGDRGNGISYNDPLTAVEGNWYIEDTNHAGWELTVESGQISLKNGAQSYSYQDSDCVRFGTSAIALCKDGTPQWSLVLNQECRINYNGLVAKGGTLTLCQVSMEKTAPLTFFCTDSKEEYSDTDPYLSQNSREDREEAQKEAEQSVVEKMKDYSEKERESGLDAGSLEDGIFYVPVDAGDIGQNVLNAMRSYHEGFRVNGVDVRIQLDEVQRLSGDDKDGLYRVQVTELCITPGNQGGGPEGESISMNYRLRIMKGRDGYVVRVFLAYEDGTYGLSGGEGETSSYTGREEYHYFLAGEYDTTYMYVNRKDPGEGMEEVYKKELKDKYPEAVTGEIDGMPCMILDKEGKTFLLYDGISEDLSSYSYWLVTLNVAVGQEDSLFREMGLLRTGEEIISGEKLFCSLL